MEINEYEHERSVFIANVLWWLLTKHHKSVVHITEGDLDLDDIERTLDCAEFPDGSRIVIARSKALDGPGLMELTPEDFKLFLTPTQENAK